MVSERSEFHFVISTISPSAPEPGRFCLLLWFGFFFDTEEEMNKGFGFFFKKKAPPLGGARGLISNNNFRILPDNTSITATEDITHDNSILLKKYLCPDNACKVCKVIVESRV